MVVSDAAADAQQRSAPEGVAAGAGAPAVSGYAAREMTTATLDRDAARARLGGEFYGIAGVPVLMIRPAANDAIVVEQRIDTGVIVRLTERRAAADEAGRVRAGPRAAERVRQDASERLARYVGALRVEIEGPLPADSLSRLLERLRPIEER
jgi:hypothetical protein